MMNLGGATASEVLYLMDLARAKVREQFGIELEPEIEFIGEIFRIVIARVRAWLDSKNIQHRGYWLSQPLSVMRVNFEFEEQAQAFAQAFGGVVLV